MLLTRILTAVIGIPIVLICIYCGGISFFILMFMISLLCVKEYLIILKKYEPHFILSLIMSAVFFIFMCFFKDFLLDKTMVSTVMMLVIFFVVEVFSKKPDLCMSRISISFIGSFFIPIAFIHMVYLRNFNGGMKLVFFIFIVVWILDTAAYAFGMMFGKHKLAKNISPKKTIEGAMIGIIFGIFATVFCKYTFIKDMLTLQNSLIIGIMISVVGQFSDLSESLIKRDGSTKNSGRIIPGHGGVLDRFDSYIFAAPAMYYILQILR